MISLIVAKSTNNGIGKDNKLLWKLSSDLKKFKSLTLGKTIVMGRKTFESIGRSLPGRKNIVITRNKNLKWDGVEIVHSVEEVLSRDDEIIICGGAEIYNLFIEHAQIVYLSQVNAEPEADTFFLKLDNQWSLINSTPYPITNRDEYSWSFQIWKKINIQNS